uniref:cupredoxin domain-containing protein n=1 Tax=Rheinheimera sp. TaxID=1869214 RepID=UPI00404869E2
MSPCVYTPSVIEVQAGSPLTLKFNRKDASPCTETVLIPALEISASLKLNDITSVPVPALAVCSASTIMAGSRQL